MFYILISLTTYVMNYVPLTDKLCLENIRSNADVYSVIFNHSIMSAIQISTWNENTIYPNVLLNQSKHIISAFECIAIIEVFCYLNKYLKCWYKWFCLKKNNSEHVQLVFSFSFNLYLTSIINCLLLEMVCVLVLYNSATIETSENQNDVFNTLLDSNK
jgi:hypothetical protein